MTKFPHKKRQHQVWRYYLKAWASDNDLINCFDLVNGEVTKTRPNIKNVAVANFFYEIDKITYADKIVLHNFIRSDPNIQSRRLYVSLLNWLLSPLREQEAANDRFQEGGSSEPPIAEFLSYFRKNAIEEVHTYNEDQFKPLLERLKLSDSSFYNDDKDYATLIIYLCSQYTRTRSARNSFIENLKSNCGQDGSRVWNLLAELYAYRIGTSLYSKRRQRRFYAIKNHTNVDFITGDQPVIQIASDVKGSLDNLAFYYPVTPRLAYVLTHPWGTPFYSPNVTEVDFVNRTNAQVFLAASQQVFATSDELLNYTQAFATKARAKAHSG